MYFKNEKDFMASIDIETLKNFYTSGLKDSSSFNNDLISKLGELDFDNDNPVFIYVSLI